MLYDVLIIGGGAAGLCCAIKLKMINPKTSVMIAEQLPRVGKKLITTGNGRCNITNRNVTLGRYHSEEYAFPDYAIKKYPNTKIWRFFSDLGVLLTFENDKAYPYSLQASSVVDALRFSADRLGVETLTETKVLDFNKNGEVFYVKTSNGDFTAKNLIVASGLYSGGDKLGSDGSIFRLLKEKGFNTVKVTPAIVQLKTDTTLTKSLKGIKVNAEVSLLKDKKLLRKDFGEVLFCDYGLSGPPIMQLSRETARSDGDFYINLDIMPEYSKNDLIEMLGTRKAKLEGILLEEFFTGMLNKRVGQAILKAVGLKLSDSASTLSTADILKTADLIKNLSFKVTGNTGFVNSQVTAGGISTREIDNKTMQSKRQKGLYFIGEIIDVDGDCGGFNLQWAWSSAFCAAYSIAGYKNDSFK